VMGHPSLQSNFAGICSTGSPFAHAVVIQPTAAGAPQHGHFVHVVRSLTTIPFAPRKLDRSVARRNERLARWMRTEAVERSVRSSDHP
jgi:hypothetical protein